MAVVYPKQKRRPFGRLLGSGDWIRTSDLRVMSPTSCLCSTPQHFEYYTRFHTLVKSDFAFFSNT